jgi:hypothetical protein
MSGHSLKNPTTECILGAVCFALKLVLHGVGMQKHITHHTSRATASVLCKFKGKDQYILPVPVSERGGDPENPGEIDCLIRLIYSMHLLSVPRSRGNYK